LGLSTGRATHALAADPYMLRCGAKSSEIRPAAHENNEPVSAKCEPVSGRYGQTCSENVANGEEKGADFGERKRTKTDPGEGGDLAKYLILGQSLVGAESSKGRESVWYSWVVSNHRPPEPQSDALTN
jgi:hypothetical protein